jgi:ribosome-associated protein
MAVIRLTNSIAIDERASSLPADVKDRLLALAGTRITADGVLLIDSREHRTQARNRQAAREQGSSGLRSRRHGDSYHPRTDPRARAERAIELSRSF